MGQQAPKKMAIWTQAGMREMLTKAAIEGAQKSMRAQAGVVTLENVGNPAGSGNPNSQRIVGGGFMLMGAVIGLAFLSQNRSDGAFPAVFGLLFALVGYCILAYRDRFVVQPEAGTWMRETGIFPFGKQQRGSLSELKGLRLSREIRKNPRSSNGGRGYIEVWAAQIVWQDGRNALDLRPLDLPTAFVDQESASEVHRAYARHARLPVIEDAALSAKEQAAILPGSSAERTPDAPLEFPGRFADSRISVEVSSDETAHFILRPRIRGISLLAPFVPLLGMIVFLWQVDKQHRDFLAHVPAQSRAFFEKSGSPIAFFLPIAIVVGVFSLAVFAFMLWKAYARRHLVVTRDTLSVYSSGFGREWGRRDVPLQDLTDARMAQMSSGGSGTISGNGFSYNLSPASTSTRSVVVYGPRHADLSIGGEGLSEADYDWYLSAARALINPATRKAALPLIALPPLTESAPISTTAMRGWKRTQVIIPGILVLSLLNSYAGGLVVSDRWTDASGTVFMRWHSFWRTGGYARTREGNETKTEASYTPFSSSTSGSLPASVGASSDYRWRIALTGTVIAEIEQAKQEFKRALAAEKVQKRAAEAAEAEKFESALPALPDAKQLNAAGDKFQSVGQWHKAILLFTRAAQAARKPEDAVYSYISIATCCYAQEKREDAKAALKQALSLSGLSEKDRKMLADQLQRVEKAKGSLHKEFLRSPSDHFPGEMP